MSPLLSALLAGSWLALVSAGFWWRGVLANRSLARAHPGLTRFPTRSTSRSGRP
jgi:hypothetical protein